MQIEVVVQFADRARDAQIFGLLDRREGPVQVLAQRRLQESRTPSPPRSPRASRPASSPRVTAALIAVAGRFRAGVELFVEALGDAGQHGRRHQIGIGVDARRADARCAGSSRRRPARAAPPSGC